MAGDISIKDTADAADVVNDYALTGVSGERTAGYIAVLLACNKNQEAIERNIQGQLGTAIALLKTEKKVTDADIADMQEIYKYISWVNSSEYPWDQKHRENDLTVAQAKLGVSTALYNKHQAEYNTAGQNASQSTSQEASTLNLNYDLQKQVMSTLQELAAVLAR